MYGNIAVAWQHVSGGDAHISRHKPKSFFFYFNLITSEFLSGIMSFKFWDYQHWVFVPFSLQISSLNMVCISLVDILLILSRRKKRKKKGTSQRRKLTGVRKEKAKHYYKSCWYPFFYIFFTKNIFSNVFLIFFLKLFWYQCIYKVTERWRTRSSVLLFSLFFCSQAWLKTWKLHSSTTEDLRKERQMCGLVSFCLLICYIIVTCLFE